MNARTRAPIRAVAVAVAAVVGPRAGGAQPPGRARGGRVDTVAVVVAPAMREPTTRLRGDTLWWVVPGAAFPRESATTGTTDTLVAVFGRDAAGRDVAWRLIGRTRRPLPPALLPVLRKVRALAAEDP